MLEDTRKEELTLEDVIKEEFILVKSFTLELI
jgi:hypothetical protein